MDKVSREFFSSIKVVAFDFDQTLVDESFSLRRRWQETLTKFLHLSDKLAETLLSVFDVKGYEYKRHLNDALQELNLPETHIQPIINVFKSTRSNEERLYDGVRETLFLLKKKGFRIGIITDGLKDYQEHRIKTAGIYDLFDFFYYGDSYQKPNSAFFSRCIENEGIQSHEFLYVGDSVSKDVEGALAIGAKACWIAENDMNISAPEDVIVFKTMYNFYQWLKLQ